MGWVDIGTLQHCSCVCLAGGGDPLSYLLSKRIFVFARFLFISFALDIRVSPSPIPCIYIYIYMYIYLFIYIYICLCVLCVFVGVLQRFGDILFLGAR